MKKDKPNPWPKKLKELRKGMNLTLAEMATAVGVPTRTYNSWEYGQRRPSRMAQQVIRMKFPKMK